MTLLLLACFRTTEPKPVTEPPPVTLGWKWVPGDSLNVELSSQASIEGQTVTRLESWEYLVREVDHEGVATLEGRLTGLGAQVTRKGETLTERETRLAREAEMERAEPVKLRIAMDGRLADLKGANWSDSLAHRLLALQLSQEPIEPGDMWPDPVVARPYADLMPVELELTVEGYHTLDGLYELDGTVLARIETRGAVRPHEDGAPEIWITGEAWWDPARGRMTSRDLRIMLEGTEGPEELTLTAREIH